MSVTVGDDGVKRCSWGASPPEYIAYHDLEWGRPVGDEIGVFETLCLEGFQAGLAWITILRKREGFRSAFAGFDPSVVAGFGEQDIERLLGDVGIVRHRAKIEATIKNARATLRLHEAGSSVAGLVWRYEPPRRVPTSVLPSTPESKALSADLRKQGFGFVGPTTVYAAMQALGVANDHDPDCDIRSVAEAERQRFVMPT